MAQRKRWAPWRRGGRGEEAGAEREGLEDALKYLHGCEYEGRPFTLEGLAGTLEVPRGEAARRLERLASLALATGGLAPRLTEEGRRLAVHVLRTHRLWERYLADRTGVDSARWHAEAERAEHTLTPEEADALSARLGHPRYDPHGDPIPTATGEMPPPRGIELPALPVGGEAVVTHLEDEPAEVYARLVRAGVAPRMRVRRVEAAGGAGAGAVRFEAEGRERTLDAVAAALVTVEPLAGEAGGERGSGETLAAVELGERARVVAISAACQGPQRRRLLDLGVVPGTEVRAELRSASGDPVAYRIRGALVALRREQAEWIRIERPEGPREES